MSISQETIRRVQEAADIVEVVEDFVPLKKKGQNWWALSPFTNEKTPSFSVSPEKGIFKCFSSGKGGDSISFIMEMEGIGFLEAIRFLAKKYNIEIEEENSLEDQENVSIRESLYIALNFAKNYFKSNLHDSQEGKSIGLSYLKERQVSAVAIEKFEIGYSLNKWNHLEEEALKNGFKEEILEGAGLIIKKEDGKKYDRFRGRVIFPIHNLSGKTLGFGARTLKKEDKPKYLNSPETEVYHKSDILYGIYQAKNSIRSKNECYLVEGYLDVISLWQEGIENVVAASGTSLTEGQIRLIKRYAKNVTILFDGDLAGIKASQRSINLMLSEDLNVKVALLPEGEDPDSYIKKVGKAEFEDFLAHSSKDFILFFLDPAISNFTNDPILKAEKIKETAISISNIPDLIKRNLYYKKCSELLQIDEEALINEGNKHILKKTKNYKGRQKTDDHSTLPIIGKESTSEEVEKLIQLDETVTWEDQGYLQEKEFVRILICYGNQEVEEGKKLGELLINEIEGIELSNPTLHKILNVYKEEFSKNQYVDERFFLHQNDQGVVNEVISFLSDKDVLSKHWEDKFQILVPQKDEKISLIIHKNLLRLKYKHLQTLCKEALDRLHSQEKITIEKQEELQKIYINLYKEKKEVAEELGIIIA